MIVLMMHGATREVKIQQIKIAKEETPGSKRFLLLNIRFLRIVLFCCKSVQQVHWVDHKKWWDTSQSIKKFIHFITHIFETVFKLSEDVPDQHVVLVHLPDVALLVREDPQQELAITVRNVGLGHYNVLSRWKSKECHHLPGHRVIGHIQRFLRIQTISSM